MFQNEFCERESRAGFGILNTPRARTLKFVDRIKYITVKWKTSVIHIRPLKTAPGVFAISIEALVGFLCTRVYAD